MSEHVTLVAYAEPSPSGLASILGALIEQNLARDPRRRRLLRPAVFCIEAPDAEVVVSLHVRTGGVLVEAGPARSAQVRVRADSSRLLALAGAPLRLGFPDIGSREGRAVIADIVRGRVKIGGLVRHPVLVSRLTLLLSAR